MIIRGQTELNNLGGVKLNEYILIYPSDTVWGIGATINNPEAFDLINKIKAVTEVKTPSLVFSSFVQVKSWVKLHPNIDEKWFKTLMSYETVLSVPQNNILKPLPRQLISSQSSQVAFRMQTHPFLDYLTITAMGPLVFSTLSKQNSLSFVLENDAFKAYENSLSITKKIIFFAGMGIFPSGEAAAIVSQNENNEFKIIRANDKASEIEKHLQLLST